MHLSANAIDTDARSRIDSSRLRAITGSMTLSSRLPAAPPKATAASLPTTWATTWHTASGMTGFTLPGMIDDPGWRSGMKISDRPVRGPLPIHRRSLAHLYSDTAMVRSTPLASTRASREPCASKWSRASENGIWKSAANLVITERAKLFGALRPVPTAVPPSGSSATRGRTACTRSMPISTAWA